MGNRDSLVYVATQSIPATAGKNAVLAGMDQAIDQFADMDCRCIQRNPIHFGCAMSNGPNVNVELDFDMKEKVPHCALPKCIQ